MRTDQEALYWYGRAMLAAQSLEMVMMTLAILIARVQRNESEAERVQNDLANLKVSTLGYLIKYIEHTQVRLDLAEPILAPEFKSELGSMKSVRDDLAHHFLVKASTGLLSGRTTELTQTLASYEQRFKRLSDGVRDYLKRMIEANGMSRVDFDRQVEERLKTVLESSPN